MPIFACNNLSKAYDRGTLFEGVSFGMEPGDRVGLIGRNGIGKTTLLKLIAGIEEPDKGSVVFNNEARFEYLHQLPVFDSDEIVLDAVMKAKPQVYNDLEEHTRLCALLEQKFDDDLSEKVQELNHKIEDADGWSLEREAGKILYKLGLRDFNQSVGSLSGGLKKRVALSKALLSDPDLLILDEPTNHLDVDSVQWLQDRLQAAGTSLLIVTHDRYFLDAVSTRIIELDQNKLYSFPGNYQTYLERKELLVEAQNSEADRARVKLRTELAWLQRGARARRTKQRSRIDWISELSKQTTRIEEKKIKIELGSSFMGSRIIDAHNISKSIGGKLLFDDYTYLARPGDRIGIIGPNGSGKSSMLNVLSGKLKTDTGVVKFGPTSKIGYFRQDNDELNPNLSVVGSLKEIAEYIDTGIGRDRYLTTKDLLNKFLFPSRQHSSLVGTLSGGEKRRLMLLRVLMANPNVLLLDEPTNDLDIQTLNSLESYLDDFYGVLIVVSHDRAFLDRCVGIVKAFDGKGNVKEYPGNYTVYLEKKESEAKELSKQKATVKKVKPQREKKSGSLKKLSYKDKREFDRLEKEIPESESEKSRIEELMNSGKIIDYTELDKLSKQLTAIEEKIDNDLMVWLELSEKTEG